MTLAAHCSPVASSHALRVFNRSPAKVKIVLMSCSTDKTATTAAFCANLFSNRPLFSSVFLKGFLFLVYLSRTSRLFICKRI